MTRASTSRPRSSVPNQCSADGGLRTSDQLVAMGSKGAISGAKTASKRKIARTIRPTTAPLRLNRRRSARRAGLSSSSCAPASEALKVASTIASAPQSGIDEDIGDVGDQVQRDVDRRGYQHHALHHGVVAVEHGIDDQLAEAGNGEDLL